MLKYGVISKGSLIIADYSETEGEFIQFTKSILAQQKSDTKQLVCKNDFMYCFFKHQEYSFLVVAANDPNYKLIAFEFLESLQEQFLLELSDYDIEGSGKSKQAILSRLIRDLINEFNTNKDQSKKLENLVQLEKELNKVNEIAKQSIDKLIERELKITSIEGKSKYLSISSSELKYNAKRLRQKMERSSRAKYYYFIAIVFLLVAGYFFFF